MPTSPALPKVVEFGRDVCNNLAAAEAREWLTTNGLGGFACGTLAGTLTRRYHGLLVAALPAPWHRTLLVSKIDELVAYDGRSYALGTNRWASGAIDPDGFTHIESFRLEGTVPVWTYACAAALIEKRIWMEHGANTTYVQYTVISARQPVNLSAKVMVNWRGYHCLTHAAEGFINVQAVDGGLRVQAVTDSPPFYIRSAQADVEPAHIWYRQYELSAELARGLDHHDDHLLAGTFAAQLIAGESITLVASTELDASLDGVSALQSRCSHDRDLLGRYQQAHPHGNESPGWIQQLVLAADQFIVSREGGRTNGTSGIAGYPWFGEWGRDTMIALPGLLLATGRNEIAADVLRTWGRLVNKGMLPNRLPEAGEAPEYNSVDAALWFIEAARQYYAATSDLSLVREISATMKQIIDEYTRGTRYNIHLDSSDGLLYAGEPGVQVTWMDAKIGDWVVTPRIGKPVEVNALWLNALATLAKFSKALGSPTSPYAKLAAQAHKGFQRFWNSEANCCFDVIDGPSLPEGPGNQGGSVLRPAGAPHGNDASIRPAQLLAVSLEVSPLSAQQQRAVVDVCTRELLIPLGLRSLSPQAPGYYGHYGGDQKQRDSAYHQGTAWGWLMGPFVHAFLRVTQDREKALNFLRPFGDHLRIHGLGTASEIFDGDPPFTPQGCFAQAWTVAEVLRAWVELRG